MRSARVRRASLEHLWVRTSHHVGHHTAGRETHDINSTPVGVVLLNGIVDLADNAKRITALPMGEACCILDVPAVRHVRGAGIDEDETVGVGVRRQLSAAEPLLSSSAARVKLCQGNFISCRRSTE